MKHAGGKFKTILFIVIASLTEASFGIYIGKIVDAISFENREIFFQRLIIAFLLIILNLLFSILARSSEYRNACEKAEKLKNTIYKRELKKEREETIDIADFTSKIDLLYDNDFFKRWLILENVFVFLFSAIAVISINWIMFLVAIAVSVIPMLIPNMLKNYVQEATSEYSKGSTEYVAWVNDTLYGRLEIIRYQIMEIFLNKHELTNNKFEYKRHKARITNYNAGKITGAAGFSTFLLVFLVGGILAFENIITVGGVIGVIQLMNNIVMPVINIATYKNELNACAPVLTELNQKLNDTGKVDEEVSIGETDGEKILRVENISYSYPGTKNKVINDFSFDFLKGKKYLIQGDSGSGKTTLAKLLSAELKVDDGQVLFYNTPIDDINRKQVLAMITYVDQESYVFKDTIFNNIDLYRNFSKEKVFATMKNLSIDNLDYQKVVDNKSGLSGGQKSRICLARAVMELPKVLIIDEPVAALDDKSSYQVMEYLTSLPTTIIVISHHVNDKIFPMFDKVINIKRGV